ncbi:MAG: molybdenum cofactor biosynthesis protein MoaE [Pseudomonadota bacterium]
MAPVIAVTISDKPIDPAGTVAQFIATCGEDAGAIGQFFGRCRSEQGALSGLELEHYPGMAEAQIKAACDEAARRWPLTHINVLHRHGLVRPGETIVAVLTASAHREAALMGVQYIKEYLKTDAPIWKRDHRAHGRDGERVQSKATDDEKRARWQR